MRIHQTSIPKTATETASGKNDMSESGYLLKYVKASRTFPMVSAEALSEEGRRPIQK